MGVRVRVREGDRLVELDAETGARRRQHVAVLPADRLLQQVGVDAVPAADALEDQEVRRAGRELDVGGADDRAAVEVRRDLRVVALRHPGDLLAFEQAADAPEVHLQDRRGAGLEHARELVLRRQPLAGRDRDRRRACDARHLLGRLGRRRLLEPERIEALEPPRQPDRARDRELPVRPEQEIAARADGLPDLPDVALAAIELVERRLPGIEGRVRPGRIELDRGEAQVGVLAGAAGRQVGIGVDVGRVAGLRVEVAVGAQPLAHASAEQLVGRLADCLADEVPHRHLDPREHADERRIRAHRVARRVDVAPGGLDVERLAPDDVAGHDVLDHARHELRRDRRRVDLAEALEATVGLELEEDEVAAAVARSRIADDEGADAGDPHGAAGGRCALWNVSTTSAIESTGTISVQAVPTMPSSAPATTSRVETPSRPKTP